LSKQVITGENFTAMVLAAAEQLRSNQDQVNALNVFPVPDGDTGTNMNLTMTSGVQELQSRRSEHLGKASEALSRGLLMGARGNSGVILSQLFRGFAKSVADLEKADLVQFAAALQNGVETAYKAVVKPVEGTILTVSKEAAKHALQQAGEMNDAAAFMNEIVQAAKDALARTPEQLPILKQVGVVDAGGQGLVHIYEGFLKVLQPGAADWVRLNAPVVGAPSRIESGHELAETHRSAQSHIAVEDIEYGYCTEFIVKMTPEGQAHFHEEAFRDELSAHGDSLLVVADDDLVKVHIHAEEPGTVMNHAMKYGALTRIKIENMREQHSHIVSGDEAAKSETVPTGEDSQAGSASTKPAGLVAIAAGDGLSDIFRSIGVDLMLSGGQTMNPSTEDIVKAIRSTPADTVYVLPNNSNIVLAAEQAKELADKRVVVIPSKTIPQGLAAAIAFNGDADVEVNDKAMRAALGQVRSGSITYAVRDSHISGMDIREGDYLAMLDNDIVVAGPDQDHVIKQLLDRMLESGDEIITVFTGQEAGEEQTRQMETYISQHYPDAECEFHDGGQPLYYYLISVE